jgi:PDZ domain/WD domain, G-beta repeat
VLDITKAEADKLKWNAPHGAKVGVVASGSPADKARLKNGDIIDLADGVEVETSSTVEKTITAKSPNTQVRLRAWSGSRERRIAVTLAEPPKMQADQGQSGLLLMLDTGGHMAIIHGLALTPDGSQLLSAGEDKVVRIWDWQAGKTVRTIRGQVAPGGEGKIYAMARCRRTGAGSQQVGGFQDRARRVMRSRLYDFVSSTPCATKGSSYLRLSRNTSRGWRPNPSWAVG